MNPQGPNTFDTGKLIAAAMQYHRQGQLVQAGELYQQVLRFAPDNVDALHLYGLILHQQGQHARAVPYIQRAARLMPAQAQLLNNLGEAQRCSGDPQAAIESLRQAVTHEPEFAGAHLNLGAAYSELGDYDAALRHAREAVRLAPDSAQARYNLGLAWLDQLETESAAAAFREAVALRPDYRAAASNLLYLLNLIPGYDADEVARQHCLICDSLYGPPAQAQSQHAPTSLENESAPLRIGYVSRDFRWHAVNFFLEPVLARHDRDRFRIHLYSDIGKPDAVTRRLRDLGHQWRSVAAWSDQRLEEAIRADQIDILVDLGGHTQKNRLAVFARKPAPIQISWLGYPNTTGLAAMDYRIVDTVTAPAGESLPGSERALRLPGLFACFRPPDDAPSVTPPPVLKAGHITFGSLHKLDKLNDGVVELWSRLLQAIPEARLLIARDELDPWRQRRLLARFATHGIDPDRLVMRHLNDPSRNFMRQFADMDIMLDTFPWSGHTLACCAVSMGVPVVTLRGATHAGRMVASLLHAMELDTLIADNASAYIEIASRLAQDQTALAELRGRLRAMLAASPLCDERGFTRGLEQAYRRIWRTRDASKAAPQTTGNSR